MARRAGSSDATLVVVAGAIVWGFTQVVQFLNGIPGDTVAVTIAGAAAI